MGDEWEDRRVVIIDGLDAKLCIEIKRFINITTYSINMVSLMYLLSIMENYLLLLKLKGDIVYRVSNIDESKDKDPQINLNK